MKVRTFFLFTLLFIIPTRVLASEIVINEIMAKPSTGEKEWIEIYNPTSSSVDLTGWVIQEKTATTETFNSYNLTGSLNSDSFYIYEFSNSKLNDGGDTINLINPQGGLIDTYSYTDAPRGKTYARIPNGANWSNDVTPSKESTNPTPSPTPTPTSAPTPTPTTTPSSSPTTTPIPTASAKPTIFTISNSPSQINENQSFSVSVNLSLPDNPYTKFYIKGAFKKSGSSNYFGNTRVSGNWVKNGNKYSNQLSLITNSSGNWNNAIELMSDIEDTGYTGNGDYIVKVGRYGESGSGPIWSNEINIKINQEEIGQIPQTSAVPSASTTGDFSDPSPRSITKKTSFKIASVAGTSTSSAEEPSDTKNTVKTNAPAFNLFTFFGGILIIAGLTSLGFLLLKSRGLV